MSEPDKKAKYIVSRYIKESQTLLPRSNVYYTIPTLVEHLCLTYYYIMNPFGNKSKRITISGKHNNIATRTQGSGWKTVFGTEWLPSNTNKIYEYVFECLENDDSNNIGLGFVTNKHHLDVERDVGSDESYIYLRDGWRSNAQYANVTFVAGDIIKLILNLSNKEITVIKNDGTQKDSKQVIFKNIQKGSDISYMLHIMFYKVKNSIKLLSIETK
eukprot:417760_1